MNRLSLLCAGALVWTLLATSVDAPALVNPNFTVVDLHAASSEVLLLEVSPPKEGKLTAGVAKVLSGKAAQGKQPRKLVLDFSNSRLEKDDIAAAFDGAGSAVGVMFVRKEENEDGDVVGSLQIGTRWMGLIRTGDDAWDLVEDPDDLETTWAGSAKQLVRAVQYVLDDRTAEFPVESGLTWRDSRKLATLTGKAHGTLRTADGIIVLCEGGDRLFKPGKGAYPQDVTDKLKLASKSRALAAGDFNADGLVDLASWDGEKLRLILRSKDGTFAPPTDGTALGECRSLSSLGDALIVARSKDVVVAKPADGGFAIRALPDSPEPHTLGAAGPAVVADFNKDGRPDVLHVFEKGLLLYAGTGREDRFAKPVAHRLDVLTAPAAVTCGDYDRDGNLDVLVAGKGGSTLLSQGKTWRATMHETGELAAAFMPGRTESAATATTTTDLRGDGRQTVAIFSADAGPGLFYARGFNCFAIAIALTHSEESNEGYDALSHGQQAAMVTDLDGDLAPDLMGVDPKGALWAVLTEPSRPRRFVLTTAAPASGGPMTVSLLQNDKLLGIHVLAPGEPTTLALPRAGKAQLTWKTPDGKDATRGVVVVRPTNLGELKPARP